MIKVIKWFTLNREVCQACGGSGRENEYIDDGDMESSNECSACGGSGYED